MASLSIVLDKPSYAPGDPIVARLVVSGADAESRTINGTCEVDGATLAAVATFVLTHLVTGHAVSGFTQDPDDPAVFHGTAG